MPESIRGFVGFSLSKYLFEELALRDTHIVLEHQENKRLSKNPEILLYLYYWF